MSSDWWWVIGATLTTIVFVVPPTIYAWYVLEGWIGAGEASYAKVMREVDQSVFRMRSRPTSTPGGAAR